MGWWFLFDCLKKESLKTMARHAGSPSKAFRVLKDHFLPLSQSQIRVQEEKLKSLRMRSNENPSIFFTSMRETLGVLQMLEVKKEDREVCNLMLGGLSHEYKTLRETLVVFCPNDPSFIETKVRERYLDLLTQPGPKKHSVALMSRPVRKSAKKQNQKSKSNSESDSSKKKIFQGKCFECGEKGHLKMDCLARVIAHPSQTGPSEDDKDENGEKSDLVLLLSQANSSEWSGGKYIAAMYAKIMQKWQESRGSSRNDAVLEHHDTMYLEALYTEAEDELKKYVGSDRVVRDSIREHSTLTKKDRCIEDWYADTGTAFHMTDSLSCMKDVKPCHKKVKGIGGVTCEAKVLFGHVQLPKTDRLWAEAMHWACEALNHTACSANPDSKSPYEMWYGEARPARPYPFLKPAYCKWQRPSKLLPKGESCFYVGPSRDHPRDCHRVLTRAGTIQETRNVTWEALPSQLPPPQPPLPIEVAEEEGEESDDDVEAEGGQETGEVESEDPGEHDEVESEDPGGHEEESMDQGGQDTESAGPGGQEVEVEASPPAARRPQHVVDLADFNTAARESDEVRAGRTRAQTRAINQQSVSGLVATLGPISASEIVHALIAEQRAGDAVELPKELIQDVEPEPGSYQEALRSKHATIWDKAMSAEVEGLIRAGTFTLAAKIPEGCNVIDARWVFKWKADETGKIVKAKARLVAKGFKQKHGVDYLETFSPTANAASIRLVVALACKYNLELLHLDIEQAFVQSKLDHEVFMKLPPGCDSMSGKIVRLNKSLYGLKQASRTFYKRLVSDLLRIGFEQSLSDPCVLRFMMGDEVMGIIAIHVDDILYAGTKRLAEVIVEALGDSLPTKNLGEVRFFLGCAFSRDREAGTIEISQESYIRSVLERFNICRTSSIPASPANDSRSVMEDEEAGDVPFREVVGCLMWIANNTRPETSNAVRTVARHSHEPKKSDWKAAQKILSYPKETAHLTLKYKQDTTVDVGT
ncbi:unnamed protein product [Ectocarpus sp. CCAP 1310/34]|nr:unnamed protein product [Ectocarpus sp. CCAP 1310/34]